MKKNVIIKTSFSAIHQWPDCPIEDVSYLKFPHRHTFHVVLKCMVEHNDRDIEIISLKNQVNAYLAKYEHKNVGRKSCEDFAEELFLEFKTAVYVSILEDNENGAEIYA